MKTGKRSWTTKDYRSTSIEIAHEHPTSDGRDLISKHDFSAKSMILSNDPDRFKVDKSVLDDPRSKLGFGASPINGANSALRPYEGIPVQVHPGILSVDPRFDAFRYELALEATKNHPANIDASGFADESAVTRDFSALLTAAGVKMSSANVPPRDRSRMLSEVGMADSFVSERHRRIFRALHKIIFGHRVAETPARFQVRSSTTMPSHWGGPGSQMQKQMMFRNIAKNVESILECVQSDDLQTLYKEHSFYIAMRLVERLQAEGVKDILNGDLTPKARTVADRKYMLTGGREGRRFVADKKNITSSVFDLPYSVGARVRTAYALCGQVNALMTMVLAGSREYYFKEGAYTWHHSTPQNIYDGIKDFETVVGLDVTTMDQYMPSFLLNSHAEWLKDYFDARYAKLVSWVNGAPYYAPQLSAGMRPFWVGDPRKVDELRVDVGLSSGRADNPDLGKWYMTGVYLCVMDDFLKDLLEQGGSDEQSMLKVVKGEHPAFGLKDMGDDAMIGVKKGHSLLAEKLMTELRAEGKREVAQLSRYALLDVEDGMAFLGNVIWKDRLGTIGRPKPNPVTFLVNRHCPERGINTGMRMYWGHGMAAAVEHYSRAGSIIRELINLESDLWRKYFPEYPTPSQMAAKAAIHQPLPTTSSLKLADVEVLLDPTKLMYKYSPDDVSDDVLNLFTATVEGDFIDKHMSRIWS